jgi:hypothetical protein
MPRHPDRPMYLTFEELEREELRRADALGGRIEDLFDDLLPDAHLPPGTRHAPVVLISDEADDEEE